MLGFPFSDLEFGTGKPVLFIMPTYTTHQPVKGAVFLVCCLPASSGDGGVVVYTPLSSAPSRFQEMLLLLLPAPVTGADSRGPRGSAGLIWMAAEAPMRHAAQGAAGAEPPIFT